MSGAPPPVEPPSGRTPGGPPDPDRASRPGPAADPTAPIGRPTDQPPAAPGPGRQPTESGPVAAPGAPPGSGVRPEPPSGAPHGPGPRPGAAAGAGSQHRSGTSVGPGAPQGPGSVGPGAPHGPAGGGSPPLAVAGGAGPETREPGRSARFAIGVAFVAVVVAVAALGVAVTALARSGDAKVQAAATTQPAAQPSAGPGSTDQPAPTDTAVAPSPSAQSSGDEEVPIPDAEPQLAYQEHELRVQPTASCSNLRGVDLDKPQVGPESSQSEFTYGLCSGTVAQLDFVDELGLSDAPSPAATALDCLHRIADAPINEPLTPSAGLTLCLTTSRNEATQEGITRKVARIAIRSVAGDGTIVVRVTAWNLAP